jgi:hypothetical protein
LPFSARASAHDRIVATGFAIRTLPCTAERDRLARTAAVGNEITESATTATHEENR